MGCSGSPRRGGYSVVRALWATIEEALAASEWFILLASPEAANSPWVEKEIDFWRRNKPVERLLIVQTDGDIAWNPDKNDFDWTKTTALPRCLSTAFTDEPRWIDARWARTGAQASLRDPRFRDLVAELAAPLRGIAKDELIGEDIRQHHRLNRWRNAALGIVTTLLIGAVAAAAIAVQQRQTAIAQRDQAQRNESRALAGLAENEVERGSPATAVRLALAALPMSLSAPNRAYAPQAEGALLFGIQRLRERRKFSHEDRVFSVAFSPDGRMLATGSRLWEMASGKEIATLHGHEGPVQSVAFSPDGRMFATGSFDSTVRLWELASGKEIGVLRGHEGPVQSVAFSPDGRMLATGSQDSTVRLWEVASGQEIGVLRHDKLVSSVAFSPDGRTLATGSWDSTARLWPLGQRVIDLACARVQFLPLSDKNRQRFGIDNEWCTPEVSSALRAKLGLDEPETSSASGGTASR
jgi:WD40 repeat protein